MTVEWICLYSGHRENKQLNKKEQTEKRAEQITILSDNKVKLSNFDFTYALGKALV